MLGIGFQDLESLITKICYIAGTPGISFGVLHGGNVIYRGGLGLHNVDAQLNANNETIYTIASLTKAFTAAMVGVLVDEGRLNWTTQLHDVVPAFQRRDAAENVTISDLLSHRSGLPSYDSLWLLSDNKIVLSRAEMISTFNYVPVAAPLRSEFIYNNIAYAALGQVIETVSGTDYASFLQDRILKPLNMSRTYYTSLPLGDSNVATPYATLGNSTPFQIPQPIFGRDIALGPAGGIRSTVSDMLTFYDALIDAAHAQINKLAGTNPQNPLKQLEHLWRGMVSIPSPTVRELSYASGWMRAQLPAPLADSGPGFNPMFGHRWSSRLALFHGGTIPGFTSFSIIFPETHSAIIVLSNSLPCVDSVRLVGQLLAERLFNKTDNPSDPINETAYIEYAELTSKKNTLVMSNIKEDLLRHRTTKIPTYPLNTYVGKYRNAAGNYVIKIRESPTGYLQISFMGLESDTFDLQPYQSNSFFWHVSYDDLAQRGRYAIWPKQYYIIEFGNSNDTPVGMGISEPKITYLRWKHDFSFENDGEMFRKETSEESLHSLPQEL
ncbi:putative D-aminoacylase [Hypoxylon trugodes]|uniref:putative D-aminoacylase n=1 Tax=Hypoxylon trugodes TaxID=326681 RepID=UPI0021994375|nr:putative D-aminoacylase [Hypoxylon trugodes]KAI1392902.1 putative D-aminoacylase [Hypoxylon trugodes]